MEYWTSCQDRLCGIDLCEEHKPGIPLLDKSESLDVDLSEI